MNTEDIRNILMLAAVEEADESGIVLPLKDRHEASRAAGAPLPANPGPTRELTFLASRSSTLLERIHSRFPRTAVWLDPAAPSHPTRHPGLVISLLAVAAVVGYLTNELGPEKRINILSFPLLGILAWSFLVYMREAWLFLARRPPSFPDAWFERWAKRPAAPESQEDPASQTLASAERLFARRWARLSAPVAAARLKSILHLAALVLAASAIGGMYVRGLANEYTAVWESTFIRESGQLLPILEFLLGPAIALGGDPAPSVGELDLIKGAMAEGENAARWIHWYALTIALFVLAPRAILAALWRLRAVRLARNSPWRETAPRYFARLLATSSGSARSVAILPYAFEPDETTKAALVRRLEDEFGAAVEAAWLPSIGFGEEENIALGIPAEACELIPVFSFAATPERETHLVLHQTLSGLSPNPVRFVLLSAAAFDRKARDFADAETRRLGREEAWRRLFEGTSVTLLLQPETMRPAATSPS